MALRPYFFDDNFDLYPSRLLDQNLGLGLMPDDLFTFPTAPIVPRQFFRPWRRLVDETRDVGSSIKADKDKFQVTVDVQHFSPEEISVKTGDGQIVIEGKHEEKRDPHGYVSRQFMRRYALPENCVSDLVESRLSSDGVLTVTAPRKSQAAIKGEHVVHIVQTGPVRKEIKDESPKSKI